MNNYSSDLLFLFLLLLLLLLQLSSLYHLSWCRDIKRISMDHIYGAYGTLRFSAASTRALNKSLSWSESLQLYTLVFLTTTTVILLFVFFFFFISLIAVSWWRNFNGPHRWVYTNDFKACVCVCVWSYIWKPKYVSPKEIYSVNLFPLRFSHYKTKSAIKKCLGSLGWIQC